MPIDRLRLYPTNPRTHNLGRIEQSIRAHGLFRSIVVSQDGFVLAGNGTLEAAQKQGKSEVAVVELPVAHDSLQAKEILAADNGAADDSGYDNDLLAALLADIREESEDGLEGTTYADDFLNSLLKQQEQPEQSQPAPPPDAYVEQYGVIVICDDESHQEEVFNALKDLGYRVKVVTT